MITLVAKDDLKFLVTLKKNKAVFVINPTATVKVSLITKERVLLAGPVTCINTAPGAAWNTSKVAVSFPGSLTETIPHQTGALLEVQVDDGGKLTWFSPHLLIVQGTIE